MPVSSFCLPPHNPVYLLLTNRHFFGEMAMTTCAMEEFSGAKLGDGRLNERLIKVAALLSGDGDFHTLYKWKQISASCITSAGFVAAHQGVSCLLKTRKPRRSAFSCGHNGASRRSAADLLRLLRNRCSVPGGPNSPVICLVGRRSFSALSRNRAEGFYAGL